MEVKGLNTFRSHNAPDHNIFELFIILLLIIYFQSVLSYLKMKKHAQKRAFFLFSWIILLPSCLEQNTYCFISLFSLLKYLTTCLPREAATSCNSNVLHPPHTVISQSTCWILSLSLDGRWKTETERERKWDTDNGPLGSFKSQDAGEDGSGGR